MAKHITPTNDVIAQIREAFEKKLSTVKLSDSTFTFTANIGSFSKRATVYFTEKAWVKMSTLVHRCSSEIGWHGLAYRTEDENEDGYIVTDILVYPQIVTGATVDTNDKYREWMKEQGIDVFRNVAFQGHSHVDFGTSPSGDDNKLYQTFLSQLTKDRFYIFMILNKKADKWIEIYDMRKNIHFESKDVDVKILDGDMGLETFYQDAVSKLERPAPAPPKYTGYTGASWYGGGAYYPPYTPPKTTQTKTYEKQETKAGSGGSKKNDRSYRSIYDDDADWFDRY